MRKMPRAILLFKLLRSRVLMFCAVRVSEREEVARVRERDLER